MPFSMRIDGNGTQFLSFLIVWITLWLHISFHFSIDSENDEHSWPFLETNRLGGFIAFVIYIVTTFSLYVPDWSFVYHNDGDVNDGKQFTVSSTFPGHGVTTETCRIWYSTCLFLQVQCGVRASLDQACNAVGYVDRQVWGINHLYTQPVWIRSKVQ